MKTIRLTSKRVKLEGLTWVQSNVPGTCVVVESPQQAFTKDEGMKIANVLSLLGSVEFPDGSSVTLRGKEGWAEFTKYWVARQALYVRVQQQSKSTYIMPETFPKALKEVGFKNMTEVIEYGRNCTIGYRKLDALKVLVPDEYPDEYKDDDCDDGIW